MRRERDSEVRKEGTCLAAQGRPRATQDARQRGTLLMSFTNQGRKAPSWGQPVTCPGSRRKPPGAPRGRCRWSACRSWGQRKGGYRGQSPGVYPPLPVRPHFSARVTTGLLSWEACSQCAPRVMPPLPPLTSPGGDRLANCVTHRSGHERAGVGGDRPWRGQVATFRPGGRALEPDPHLEDQGGSQQERAAGGTGGGGRGEAPACSW